MSDAEQLPGYHLDPDPLPTERQRQRLCEMMHHAFVEMRLLGWGGHAQQIADLADAFHNLPQEMYAANLWRWANLRSELMRYQQRYPDSPHRVFIDYVRRLDEIRAEP
jgi:hypothetical protein